MLKTRIVTALILLAVFIPSAIYLPQREWALLMALVIGVAAWEWGALLLWTGRSRLLLGVAAFALAATAAWFCPDLWRLRVQAVTWLLYGAAAFFWLLVLPCWLKQQWRITPPCSPLLGVALGFLLLAPTWLAAVQLRSLGVDVLLAVLVMVWLADIAAYFSGRAFGRHKLAPSISPGKTREGAIGALLFVALYAFWLHGYALLPISRAVFVLLAVLLAVASIVGDLLESLLKRKANLKDSSQILPGHGGVLDRIDSLTSTLPLTAFLLLCWQAVAAAPSA